MFRTSAFACLAALCALPAAAQYIDQGFRDAHAIFGNVSSDSEVAQMAMEKLLPALEGRWIPVDILAGGGPTSETANAPLVDYEQFCGEVVYDLTVTSRFSFEMMRHFPSRPDSPSVTYRFDYAGYNGFVRSRDTDEFLTYLGLQDEERLSQNVLGFVISQTIVSLYHPNRDTLVLVNLGGRTEYYGRCP